MNDDPMNPRSAGGDELARRLEAYARARLSPDSAAVARIRARVMLEARTQLDGARAGAETAQRPTPIGRARSARRLRRGAAILLAAALSVSTLGGVAFAAQPGGPLYDARLWIEAATLPSDPAARTAADVKRLEDRLGEILRATRDGNEDAIAAALAAYQAVVDDALRTAGADDALLAKLEEVLGKHLAVLNGLLDKVPEQARKGIENAIDKSDNALDKAGGQGSQGGGQGDNPNAGRSPKPTPGKTPKPPPEKTPPAQAKSPQPERTPQVEPGGPPASHPGGGPP
jgi:hypothetical protein